MAEYKFDGRILRSRHNIKIAEVDGKYIKDSHNSRIGEIDGIRIKDGRNVKVPEFDGHNIRDNSNKKIGTISDVQKMIEGPGGMTLAALWVLVVR